MCVCVRVLSHMCMCRCSWLLTTKPVIYLEPILLRIVLHSCFTILKHSHVLEQSGFGAVYMYHCIMWFFHSVILLTQLLAFINNINIFPSIIHFWVSCWEGQTIDEQVNMNGSFIPYVQFKLSYIEVSTNALFEHSNKRLVSYVYCKCQLLTFTGWTIATYCF